MVPDIDCLAAAMVRLQNTHVEAFPNIYRPFGLDDASSHLKQILSLANSTIRVALVGKIVVGHVVFTIEERSQCMFKHAQKYGHIPQIEVNPSYRGAGLGRMLLTDCDQLAKSNKIAHIVLDVWAFNYSARSFFVDFGYEDFGSKLIRYAGS